MQRNTIISVLAAVVVVGGAVWYFSGAPGTATDTTTTTSSETSTGVVGATVSYTEAGFSPMLAQVKVGTAIKFVNNSSKALRIVSVRGTVAAGVTDPGFDSGKSIGNGASWVYTPTIAGQWDFKNLDDDSHVGTLIVTAQ